MGDPGTIFNPERPSTVFDDAESRLKEIKKITRKARAGSAPGPNRIPYMVYKSYPRLLQRLRKLKKVLWRIRHLPDGWLRSEGSFIPKLGF